MSLYEPSLMINVLVLGLRGRKETTEMENCLMRRKLSWRASDCNWHPRTSRRIICIFRVLLLLMLQIPQVEQYDCFRSISAFLFHVSVAATADQGDAPFAFLRYDESSRRDTEDRDGVIFWSDGRHKGHRLDLVGLLGQGIDLRSIRRHAYYYFYSPDDALLTWYRRGM